MLRVEGISASYGAVRAIEKVSLRVDGGQIVCLLGANGAGKTTTLNCVSGVVPVSQGSISFEDRIISRSNPNKIVSSGVLQVPEGREIFRTLSVEDNLRLGSWTRRRAKSLREEYERVYSYFPILKTRARQSAGTLSGGEQQMLMIGRALMGAPKLLLLDEPSLGLSPVLVDNVFTIIKKLHADGLSILLVEQNARLALAVSDYAYILENGEVKLEGPAAVLANDPKVRSAYLGT